MKILQCLPNFSEGRDPGFLEELATVLKRFPVKVLDLSRIRTTTGRRRRSSARRMPWRRPSWP